MVDPVRNEIMDRLGGCFHDRFPHDVKAGVKEACGSRNPAKLRNKLEIHPIVPAHRLDPACIVLMHDGRKFAALTFSHRKAEYHVRRMVFFIRHVEILMDMGLQYGSCKRPEGLPPFNYIHSPLHVAGPWLAEDRAVAERPGSELGPALEPADYFSACQKLRRLPDKAVFGKFPISQVGGTEGFFNFAVPVFRT